jgi:hypothetical protein
MMMGRPAVVRRRPMLRAAAIGGTFAAGRAVGRRAQETAYAEQSQDQRISDLEAGQVPAQPTGAQYQAAPGSTGPASAGAGDREGNAGGTMPVLDQLSKLTEMHDQGALTDEEFAAAKAKVLGG